MGDVDDIIDYIKSLKKGFDKDLFQNKIEELGYIVDNYGLNYDDFHTLFKLWLNISIPITKWINLGACLVPEGRVEERTVDYAFRCLLNNCEISDQQGVFSRMAFLLDWLTAAMDSGAVNMEALDSGYEIFYNMLYFEVLAAHAVKLMYTLTKPSDVTRRRVQELLDLAKKREGKKNMLKHIQVLLGLFKSYKPECVPENIPAISAQTSFKKINITLMNRFQTCQERQSQDKSHLLWINPINLMSGRNKNAAPLVPNMEFNKIGSTQYSDKESMKTYFDFADATSLLKYSLRYEISRPARLRALLCNETGLTLLALSSHYDQAFLWHELHHLLTNCFLCASPYTWGEKQDLLYRLSELQRTLLQGVPVVTAFLARYLPLWNEADFFGEILNLVEWVHVESAEQISMIIAPLCRAYHRAQPLHQCAILRCLTNMYSNLLFSWSRSVHFLSTRPTCEPEVLAHVQASLMRLVHHAAQATPEDIRVLFSGLSAIEAMKVAELQHGVASDIVPDPLTLALPFITPSGALLDKLSAVLMLYREHMKMLRETKQLTEHIKTQLISMSAYQVDLVHCLFDEAAFTQREDGVVFNALHPQTVSKLTDLVPKADSRFSLRNHLAFAAYTFKTVEEFSTEASNDECLDNFVFKFRNLHKLLTKIHLRESI